MDHSRHAGLPFGSTTGQKEYLLWIWWWTRRLCLAFFRPLGNSRNGHQSVPAVCSVGPSLVNLGESVTVVAVVALTDERKKCVGVVSLSAIEH
eukprot:scaffold112962_cov60-Attheya_sp.AAC.3